MSLKIKYYSEHLLKTSHFGYFKSLLLSCVYLCFLAMGMHPHVFAAVSQDVNQRSVSGLGRPTG